MEWTCPGSMAIIWQGTTIGAIVRMMSSSTVPGYDAALFTDLVG